MSALAHALQQYLAVRRAFGYRLESTAALLRDWVAYLARARAPHITTALALRWAQQSATAQPAEWAKRLGVVRRFARHLSAFDVRHEVPPVGLLPFRARRQSPYLYSDTEIRALLRASRGLPSPARLRAATYATLIGLLVVTGLRISEALGLDDPDVDLVHGILTIRRTKFGKSRFVPLHPSTVRALRRYQQRRNRILRTRATASFLIGEHGRRLSVWAVRRIFNRLSRQTGLRGPTDRRGPRLHDFRHRLAVTTLVRWYRRGVNVEHRLPALSTYLGHRHVTDTYWYLSAVPVLLRLAADRLESRRGPQP